MREFVRSFVVEQSLDRKTVERWGRQLAAIVGRELLVLA